MHTLSKRLKVLRLSVSTWLETGYSSSEEASEASVSSWSKERFQDRDFQDFLILDASPGLRASPLEEGDEEVLLALVHRELCRATCRCVCTTPSTW